MRSTPTPGPGSIVTFRWQGSGGSSPITRGVVVGHPLRDPFTGSAWLPVKVLLNEITVVRNDALLDITGRRPTV